MKEESHTDWLGLLPKVETQALSFVNKNSAFDGRGVVVGILDTGVAPGAIGLQVTTDGKPKIIDIVDCSGSGDVSMSAIVKAVDGIINVDGRTIKINPSWNNPTSEYRVGIKRAYELYPKDLKERVREDRKKKFLSKHREKEASIRQELSETSSNADSYAELKAKLELYKSVEKEFEDIGPLYDCLVFHDGEHWNGVIDTTETGDMSTLQPMVDYNIRLESARFSDVDALVYGINIFDQGSILSIVTDAGAHGSHVAGIVAAYHPDNPECNGVAPGAQIISLKIGDTRLGSMETGTSLIRGLLEAVRRGCHIINMSYGEATAWDNEGKFVKLAEEIVHKYGIIFVASAGNNGPCLSTVGVPGGTSSCVIGVAALATESLMQTAYAMTTVQPATNYTWSSVGPCLDGDLGVSIIAPGAAITSVPSWTLARHQLMNGTSMSSPNATGCLTLLLSAAKAQNILTSPTRVRHAIENSATHLPQVERLGQGHGLVQVSSAWDWLLKGITEPVLDIPLSVAILSERFSRGVYLRQAEECSRVDTFKVQVTPIFKDDVSPDVKIQYELRVSLKATVPWVTCADRVLIGSQGKIFNIIVDPTSLGAGVHTAFVYGSLSSRPDLGFLFAIPVTIVKPEVIPPYTTSYSFGVMNLPEAVRERRFIVPPPGCTFIDYILKDKRPTRGGTESGESNETESENSGRQVVSHALQLVRGTPYRDMEKESYFMLTPGAEFNSMSMAVVDGLTVEVCLSRFWSTVGDTTCELILNFRGVQPSPEAITITPGQRVSNLIYLHANLSNIDISPIGKLDKWISIIKPLTIGKVIPLGERDQWLDNSGKIFQMILDYEIDMVDIGDITPRWPGLNNILYESDFIGQFHMIFDTKKKLLGVGDAWPKSIKLNSKGKHTIRLQIKHENASILETLSELPLYLERSLKTNIALSFYKSQANAFSNSTKFSNRPLTCGSFLSLVIKEPASDQIPKSAVPGDVLSGSVTYERKLNGAPGSGTRPGGYPVQYIVGDNKITANSTNSSTSPKSEGLLSIVRDAKIKYLKSLTGESTFMSVYTDLTAEYASYLPLLQTLLSHTGKISLGATPSVTALLAVVSAADGVLTALDTAASTQDTSSSNGAPGMDGSKDKDKERKSSQMEALVAKATAQLGLLSIPASEPLPVIDLLVGDPSSETTENDLTNTAINSTGITSTSTSATSSTAKDMKKAFQDTYAQILKLDDLSADKYWQLVVGKHKVDQNFALALKRINDLISSGGDNKSKDVSREKLYEERSICYEKLGWNHCLAECRKSVYVNCKSAFDPF